MIYVGTCGFSYRDWIGAFYPAKIKASEMLSFYARRFRAVEIDSSYYALPTARAVAAMAARTPPGFRLSFKAPQSVTHPPDPSALHVHDDARLLCQALEPAAAAGKLACVLLQFPHAMKPEGTRVDYVARTIDALGAVPAVVEFRNAAWQTQATLDLLHALGAGYCNADMPHLDGLLHPSSDVTSRIGYVRLHGRNANTWWRGSNVTRYDYFYAPEELGPWADRVAEIEAQAEETYVFFNNHAVGNATRNAQTMQELLDERYGTCAEEFVARGSGGAPEQPGLFGEREPR